MEISEPQKIYMVVHKSYENINCFFMNLESAEQRINEYLEKYSLDSREDYKILELVEGESFMAGFFDLLW